MKTGLKKALSLLSAFCVAFSMTGCFDLYRTINKDKNINDLKAEISEGNFVEEWTGDIPAGKKVRYVLARDVNVGVNDIKNVYTQLEDVAVKGAAGREYQYLGLRD